MRLRAGAGKRAELAWLVGSFLVIQLLLGSAIDRGWTRCATPNSPPGWSGWQTA